jgi:hypothetical protein
MKYKGIWTSDPSHPVQDWPKKNSFLGQGPWAISYRLSHKRPQSVNPMESSSVYGRTDERTIAYSRKYAKKLVLLFATTNLLVISINFAKETMGPSLTSAAPDASQNRWFQLQKNLKMSIKILVVDRFT